MQYRQQFQGFPTHSGTAFLSDTQTFKGLITFKRAVSIVAEGLGGTLLSMKSSGGNIWTVTMASNGGITYVASSGGHAFTTQVDFSASGITIAKAQLNLTMPSAAGITSTTGGSISGVSINGVSTTFRVGLGVSSGSSTIANIGDNYACVVIGTNAATEQASGTHPIICNLAVRPLTVTNAGASTTDLTSLYVEGPPTGITPTNPVTSIWVDTGISRFDGVLQLGVSVSAAGTLTLDTTANTWIATGTTTTWTLPALSVGTGIEYKIKNKGSGAITLNSNAGGNDIYNTSAVSTISIPAGQGCIIVNDGTNWTVISLA